MIFHRRTQPTFVSILLLITKSIVSLQRMLQNEMVITTTYILTLLFTTFLFYLDKTLLCSNDMNAYLLDISTVTKHRTNDG